MVSNTLITLTILIKDEYFQGSVKIYEIAILKSNSPYRLLQFYSTETEHISYPSNSMHDDTFTSYTYYTQCF